MAALLLKILVLLLWPLYTQTQGGLSTGVDSEGQECTREPLKELLTRYEKQLLRVPTEVVVNLYVDGFTSIAPTLTTSVTLSLTWQDPQLQYSHLNPCRLKESMDYNTVHHQLWTPQITFSNSDSAVVKQQPEPQSMGYLYANGTVFTSTSLQVTVSCHMNLALFPMDVQSCRLQLESARYSSNEIKLLWDPSDEVSMGANIKSSEFMFLSVKPAKQTLHYAVGTWDQLTVTLIVARCYGHYIMRLYIPTCLAVFVSFLAFWINPGKGLSTRLLIGLGAMVFIQFQYSNVVQDLPKISYLTAADMWIGVSVAFVFLSLIAHIVTDKVANCTCGKTASKRNRLLDPTVDNDDGDTPVAKVSRFAGCLLCPVVFPIVYLVFVVIYWLYYLGSNSAARI